MSTGPAAALSLDDLQKRADSYVKRLQDAFTKTNAFGKPKVTDYWKSGNAACTLLDYFQLGSGKVTNHDFIAAKHRWFETTHPGWFDGKEQQWFDDYLWWAIAALKNTPSGNQPPIAPWDAILKTTWTSAQPSRTVWTKGAGFDQYQPRVEHGVWNAAWGPKGPWVNNSWNEGAEDDLWGIQNAVVNSLYLNVAAHTAQFDRQFLEIALEAYRFLSAWFKVRPADNCLLYTVPPPPNEFMAVIRERVSTFHNEERDPHYNPKFYWTGDQGLLLGAAMHLMGPNVPSDVRKECSDLALAVIRGVKRELVENGELQPYKQGVPVPMNDIGDYNSGTGVYLRYVFEAWGWPELKAELHTIGFDDLVVSMANKVPDPPPQYDPDENKCLNLWTNQLATLLVAIAILKSPAH